VNSDNLTISGLQNDIYAQNNLNMIDSDDHYIMNSWCGTGVDSYLV